VQDPKQAIAIMLSEKAKAAEGMHEYKKATSKKKKKAPPFGKK